MTWAKKYGSVATCLPPPAAGYTAPSGWHGAVRGTHSCLLFVGLWVGRGRSEQRAYLLAQVPGTVTPWGAP